MEIRTFDEKDRDAVIALWRDVFAYPTPHNDPALSIDRKLAAGVGLFFVATVPDNSDGQRVVGTVMGGYDGHRGWVYSLAVAPDYRGRGLGTALMHHLERHFQELGCPKINLQVLLGNEAVVTFYQRLGYRVEQRVSMGKPLIG